MDKNLQTITEIVKAAANIMLEAGCEKGIVQKTSLHDLVTVYDKKVQDYLYRELSAAFPDAGFLGEEQLLTPSKDGGTFVIDPIDGTTNFIKGLGQSAVSVGYVENGGVKYAVVCNPFKDETFSAVKGGGAFLNGKPIEVSDQPLERAVAHYGTSPYNAQLREKSFRLACLITSRVIDSRRMGAACLDLCNVACGRGEMFFEYQLSPWDYCAGVLIAAEAGAIVTDMEGNALQFENKSSVIAATPRTYDFLRQAIAEIG